MFIHHVNFFLKAGSGDEVAKQLIADCRKYLSDIPTVRQLWAGPPAMTPRDVVDNSYDVGLCVIFDDTSGHDVYQTHPRHDEFIERNKAHWAKVIVRDFLG
jgi:hypothetical protein